MLKSEVLCIIWDIKGKERNVLWLQQTEDMGLICALFLGFLCHGNRCLQMRFLEVLGSIVVLIFHIAEFSSFSSSFSSNFWSLNWANRMSVTEDWFFFFLLELCVLSDKDYFGAVSDIQTLVFVGEKKIFKIAVSESVFHVWKISILKVYIYLSCAVRKISSKSIAIYLPTLCKYKQKDYLVSAVL